MGEWRHDSADDEDLEDASVEPADIQQLAAEVEDVLSEGEATGDPGCVDHPVDGTVEEPSGDEEDQQDAEALCRLLDDWRLDGCAEEVVSVGPGSRVRVDPVAHPPVDEKRDDDCRCRPPEECEYHCKPRLRLPPVDPADAEEHDRQRDQRHDAAEREGIRTESEDQVGEYEKRRDGDHDHTDDSERASGVARTWRRDQPRLRARHGLGGDIRGSCGRSRRRTTGRRRVVGGRREISRGRVGGRSAHAPTLSAGPVWPAPLHQPCCSRKICSARATRSPRPATRLREVRSASWSRSSTSSRCCTWASRTAAMRVRDARAPGDRENATEYERTTSRDHDPRVSGIARSCDAHRHKQPQGK